MTGSLIKRSKHSYTLKLELDKDPITGKRRQKWITFKGNKKQAQNELTRLLNEVNTGVFVEPAKMTVSEFLDRWVKDYAEVNVSGKTLERYKSAIEKQIKPALGHLPIQKLTPLHIQTFYSDCMKDGGRKDGRKGALSAQTVLHFHRLLFQALKHALRWRLLARNPAEAVEPPRVPQKEMGILDDTRSAWLLEAAIGTRLYIPIMLALCAGLRRGEILAVRWQDLDVDGCTLQIRRSLEQTRAAVTFKEPKSQRGRRTVALPPVAVEALRIHRAEQHHRRVLLADAYAEGDLICSCDDGTIWKPSAFTSAYRDLLRRRKLDGPNFHALRHSHASQLLRQGIDMKVISSRLGHSRTAFTADTYIHLLPGQDQEAARRVDVVMREAMSQKRPVN